MKLKDYKRRLNAWVERCQSFCDLLCPALAQGQRVTDVVHHGDRPFAEVWYLTYETLILQARIQRMLHAIEALWGESESRWIQQMRAKVQRNARRLNEHRQVLASLMDFVWERLLQEERDTTQNDGETWMAALDGQGDATKFLYYRLIRCNDELPLLAQACQQMGLFYPQETVEALRMAHADNFVNGAIFRTALRKASWHYDRYRVSNLLVSWLEKPQSREEGKMHEIVERLPEDANLPWEERENLSRILERLSSSIREVGYEQTIEWVTGEDRMDGPDSALGNSRPVNVIPGGQPDSCRPILIAFARGESQRRSHAFPNVMRRVKTHLIACANVTRVCVFIADTWNRDRFMKEHFGELRAHHHQFGVRFVFLLAGSPAGLSAIEVDFSRAAELVVR